MSQKNEVRFMDTFEIIEIQIIVGFYSISLIKLNIYCEGRFF